MAVLSELICGAGTAQRKPVPPGQTSTTRAIPVIGIPAAVWLGCVVRVAIVFSSRFPLNDGGLFYAMVRDLQHAGYRLPAYTSYNGAGIPFAYSPLGFYVAGFLNDLTPLSLFSLLRIVPLIVSCLTCVAFARLVTTVIPAYRARVAAVFAFALVPRSFIWLLMGGGLTRSFGLLFALLALREIYVMYTNPTRQAMLLAAVFTALTLLSHLETCSFLLYSAGVLFLFRGRSRGAFARSLVVGAGAALLSAPWWVALLRMDGVQPFLSARTTSSTVFTDGGSARYLLTTLVHFAVGTTQEPLFPLIALLGALGGLVCLSTRRGLLTVWWAAAVLLDARGFQTYTMVPLAMLAGVAIDEAVVPLLQRLSAPAQGSGRIQVMLPANGFFGGRDAVQPTNASTQSAGPAGADSMPVMPTMPANGPGGIAIMSASPSEAEAAVRIVPAWLGLRLAPAGRMFPSQLREAGPVLAGWWTAHSFRSGLYRVITGLFAPLRRAGPVAIVLGFLVCYATVSALVRDPELGTESQYLVGLSPDERSAMQWVAATTPPASAFLVVTARDWPVDKTSEWFPTLADRRSVATAQGYEWLPGNAWTKQVEAFKAAQQCAYLDSWCITNWTIDTGTNVDYIYIPKTPAGRCCWVLADSLAGDPGYTQVYDGRGATIFARR